VRRWWAACLDLARLVYVRRRRCQRAGGRSAAPLQRMQRTRGSDSVVAALGPRWNRRGRSAVRRHLTREAQDLSTEFRSSPPRRPERAESPATTRASSSAFAFELLESKLLPPQRRGGSVPRATIIDRMEGPDAAPVVCVSAGPGWGKTTLLGQWASRAQRPFAWVDVDQKDNDPIVLLTYVAAALDRVSPLDASVFDALCSERR
jgi:hypothetical protein